MTRLYGSLPLRTFLGAKIIKIIELLLFYVANMLRLPNKNRLGLQLSSRIATSLLLLTPYMERYFLMQR